MEQLSLFEHNNKSESGFDVVSLSANEIIEIYKQMMLNKADTHIYGNSLGELPSNIFLGKLLQYIKQKELGR